MSNASPQGTASGFNMGAAVTRSLLGWGVVAGPFYLIVGLIQALTVPGFDISRHALSLLMLAPLGWIQTVNLILSGLMVAAAAVGFARVMPAKANGWVGGLLGIYALCLVASAIFPPDPMGGFPLGAEAATTASISGLLHLAFGALGFVSFAVAAVLIGRWFRSVGRNGEAMVCWIAAAVIVIGFVGGAALSMSSVGVALLWLAVVAGWAFLFVASLRAYRIAPHPDGDV